MGYYGLTGFGIGKKMKTEAEKKEQKFLQDIDERLKELQQKGDMKERMDRLGQRFNLLTFLAVFHSSIIFKAMMYNFVSGFLNMLYGVISNYLFDGTGFFWKPGNGQKIENHDANCRVKSQ